jgi:hypothetical protein
VWTRGQWAPLRLHTLEQYFRSDFAAGIVAPHESQRFAVYMPLLAIALQFSEQ